MKVLMPISKAVEDGALQFADLSLCGQGRPEGSAEGLIGLKLTTSNVRVTPRIVVTSATSTSKRGVRSAVIKVSMPYTAFTRDENNAIIVDPKRSTGEVSMHIVINLPASAVGDLRSTDGTANANPAYSQVVVISQILRALISKGLLERGSMTEVSQDEEHMLVGPMLSLGNPDRPDDVGYTHALAVPATDSNGDFVFDATKITREAFSDLANTIVRIANGLPPLGCSDVKANHAFPGT